MPVAKRRSSCDETTKQHHLKFRRRLQAGDYDYHDKHGHVVRAKRPHLEPVEAPPPSHDIISNLSDEVLIRIFSYLDVRNLVDISPVSKRFYNLSADSQLWRMHYYQRFVSLQAHQIPAFKVPISPLTTSSSSQNAGTSTVANSDPAGSIRPPASPADPSDPSPRMIEAVDWKRHFKLRYNWSRGQCAVQEVPVSDPRGPLQHNEQTLIRVADGLAITADLRNGMRAWDLHIGTTISHTSIETHDGLFLKPTTIALDTQNLSTSTLDIILGFEDGTFGLWRLDIKGGKINLLYRQERSFVGTLVAVAYSHPYVMTAAESGFVLIYTFISPQTGAGPRADNTSNTTPFIAPLFGLKNPLRAEMDNHDDHQSEEAGTNNSMALPTPYLLKQLKSHNSRVPLALCISGACNSITASIAYTFHTVGGWSIGVQDFDIRPSDTHDRDVVTSRVAYSLPMEYSRTTRHRRPSSAACPHDCDCECNGPNKLVFSHPYLLATMPDNTMIMHLCTHTADSFKISRGIRLWGHTSAVADADITPRGKAVSISLQGNELRVWELGEPVARPSIQVRPRHRDQTFEGNGLYPKSASSMAMPLKMEDQTSWIGFDKEMIVVLRAASSGRENMVVYDFT